MASGKKYPLAVRLINEIVLAEESDVEIETDVGPTGQYLSHYEMYRMAMVQAGWRLVPKKLTCSY